jgi:hypothetical protein
MNSILEPVTDVQDRIVHLISSTKKPVADAVSTVVDFVLDRVPEVPALPYAELLPTPLELIDNQAKFASKVVSTSKAVASGAAKAATPLTDQLFDRTPTTVGAAAKKATKPVVKAA